MIIVTLITLTKSHEIETLADIWANCPSEQDAKRRSVISDRVIARMTHGWTGCNLIAKTVPFELILQDPDTLRFIKQHLEDVAIQQVEEAKP